MCALDDEGELVFPDKLNSPSSGGSGAPNTGAIYAQYPAPAEGKYMMVSYLGSSIAEADSRIRALAGGYNPNEPAMESVTWKLLALPSDAVVLENLRQQVNNGDVIMKDENGNAIPADKLTTDNYVVRWIQVKYQSGSGDGWNINAILKSKFDYTVRYDANGGEGTMSDQIIRYDETVALTENAFTRAHYRFVGWKDGDGNSYSDKQSVRNLLESAGTVTLYAQWDAEVEVSASGSEKNVTYNGKVQSNDIYTVIYTVGGVQGALPAGITANVDVPTVSGINAGTYTGTVTAVLSGSAEGYVIKTASASADIVLTVGRAAVTVKANNVSKTAGSADPDFTATIIGLVNGDNASRISYSFVRETGETAGTYTVTPTGAAVQGNYTVSFVPGTLTIEPVVIPTPTPEPTPAPVQPPAPV
ncbi:MAG: InlB B-repeat-containing protein, partial [Clostridia bacterium]|nr:InlB B-repeat-containing protein [Clostridia bacterium]